MPSYKTYTDAQYKAFLKNKISSTFGLSDEKLADWFMSQAGAKPVINSYGVTKKNLLSSYIPKIKEYQGSASFFLFYTVTEGGGAGNWINHYMTDQGSNGMECLISDLEYCKSINNNYPNYPVTMTAQEVAGTPPQADIDKAQKVYNEVGKGTIGAIMMPSTMAGNAWIFAEKWCLDHQGPSAPAVYFGNPYDLMIKTIKSAGVDPFEGTGGDGGDTGGGGTTTVDKDVHIDNSRKRQQLEAKVKELFDTIRKKFNTNVYTASDQYLFNNVVKLTRGMNLWKVKLSDKVLNELMKTLDDAIEAIVKDEDIKVSVDVPNTGGGDKPGGGDTPSGSVSEATKKALAKLGSQLGQHIGSGQCYAMSGYFAGLISGYTCDFSTTAYGFKVLPKTGSGEPAYSLWSDWDWSKAGAKTKGYNGIAMPAGDLREGMIYCIEANNGYFQTYGYGHTGVVEKVTDSTIVVLEQNYAGKQYICRNTYDKTKFLQGVTGVVWWE